jgi:hypothetical protein
MAHLTVDRAELLATEWLTLTELAARRGDPEVGPTGAWVAGQLRAGALIAVPADDRSIVVPAFQVTATGEPRPDLLPLLSALAGEGLDGWTRWAWLTRPADELGGAVPERMASADPDRALQAAQRFAAAYGRQTAG